MSLPRPCLGCGVLVVGRNRCRECARGYEARRAPHRVAYQDPAYKAMKPHGLCEMCKKAPATTRDHIVPLQHGGTNHPANLRFLCRSCNSRKGAKLI